MSRSALSVLMCLVFALPAFGENLELAPMPREVATASAFQLQPGLGEVLPRPQPIVEMGPLGPVLPGYWRRSEMAKWQLLAVDYQGRFRPRVVLAPCPYYLHDGMPYPWLSVNPLDVNLTGGR
jgi:hypothetical protein